MATGSPYTGLALEADEGLGRIRLERPRALNALGMEMYRGLLSALEVWSRDDSVRAVVIEGEGDRAFCAGGDIRALWEARAQGDTAFQHDIFRIEYTMNRLINRYPKPYVALMDGVTMGGGCGVSVHGSHRVVTERTLLAMPECGIGFFPDIGASWFLPRCPGRVGLYLGLTGARIGAADAIYAGLADTFVPSERLEDLIGALEDGASPDDALSKFSEDAGPSELAARRDDIERGFAGADLAAIRESASAADPEWAAMLEAGSPFSQAVALEAFQRGEGASIEDCMIMEYRICRHFLERDEFFEGIRAAVVDKDRSPAWEPAPADAAAVAACFAPLGNDDLRLD